MLNGEEGPKVLCILEVEETFDIFAKLLKDFD